MKERFLIALLLLFMLAGCTGTPENPEPTLSPTAAPSPTQAAPEPSGPTYGGVLRIPMRLPKTLNPLLNEDETVDTVLRLLYEPLMALDDTLKPVGNLAGFSFSSDGMSVSVEIRDGAIWSDGTPVTAEDLAFSIETLQQAPENAIYKPLVKNISQVSVLDERKARVYLLQPFSGTRYQFRFPIIPKHHFQGATDPGNAANMNPVGNGLFVFSSYDSKNELKLTASNATYRQKPFISSVSAIIVPDQETEMHSYDQRLLDVVSAELADWGRYRNNQTTTINEYTTMYYDFIGFNFNNEALSDKRVRQAVAFLVDADDAIESIYLSRADKSITPVNPRSWLYEKNVASYPLDVQKAKTLFTQAKFTSKLRILVNTENVERVKIAQTLADNLAKADIDATVEELPYDEYLAKVDAKDFDIFAGGFNLSVIPELSFAFQYSIDYDNIFGYRDDTTNGLLASAFSAVAETSCLKAMSDLQKRLAEELPCIGIAFRRAAMLTDQKVKGPIKPNMDNIFANINTWYLTQ
jgi:peptide/nickel transport system substrate-binding protein